MPEFSFDNQRFHSLLSKAGFRNGKIEFQTIKAIVFVTVCWLPLAAYTLLHGSFWTGNIQTSFITHFDTQARLLIALPLLILCESRVRTRLSKILMQFSESEIIEKAEVQQYGNIIERNVGFLRSRWTDIVLLLLCYLQVFLVFKYETTDFSSLFSWQTAEQQGVRSLNFAGRWNEFVSKPLMLFILYRWLLRTIVWGNIMRKISKLNLNLYPLHPDQLGGLGFLGFTLNFFSPVAFALSVVVAGHFADFMLLADMHLADLKFVFIVYFIFINLLFSLPLIAFARALGKAREDAIFKYYDLAAGMHRELVKRITAKEYKVEQQDLDVQHYSSVCDFNGLMVNALQMKSLPFKLKDLLPLWIATIIPFIPVILIEIPFVEILKTLSGLLM